MKQASDPVKRGVNGKKNQPAKSARSSAPSAKPDPVPPTSPTSTEESGDLVTALWLRFSRFGWDVLGVLLIAAGLVTVIGLLDQSQAWATGFFITPWASLVGSAFGWGWSAAVISLVALGIFCLRRRRAPWKRFRLSRVLLLEGLYFSLLTLFAILGGFSLQNAMNWQDGGIVGWGLAYLLSMLLPVPFSTLLVAALIVLFAGFGLGFFQWIGRTALAWANAVQSAPAVSPQASAPVNPPVEAPAPPPPGVDERGRSLSLPPLSLVLDDQNMRPDEEQIQETGALIEHTLAEFGIPAKVIGYRVGPTVTQFAVEPGFTEKIAPDGKPFQQKVRVSQISALSRDLALSLSAERLRIEAPVPGESFVGIEVPNQRISIVRMRSLLDSEAFRKLSSPLAVVLGRDVSGHPMVADLARMPHLLIAGTTGSGKSVCIGAITTCLVMNNTPDSLRLAMLDPKMVELNRFNGLPHILGRVETEVERMLGVLKWALMEMDRRYRLLEDARTRDIISYNARAARRGEKLMPRIVVMIDELADLMMTAPDQTEHSLIRLAQMARATGIHLVVATQRPSTDVVTGLIKANFPARMAFSVASGVDSRVILDTPGAETLLGKGDMLFLNPESGSPARAQGAWVTDGEIDAVIGFWREKYKDSAPEAAPWEAMLEAQGEEEDSDQLVQQAILIVRQAQRASASLLQRRLRVGYPRAARLMDELEELGIVGPSQGGGKERDVLLPPPVDGEDLEKPD